MLQIDKDFGSTVNLLHVVKENSNGWTSHLERASPIDSYHIHVFSGH